MIKRIIGLAETLKFIKAAMKDNDAGYIDQAKALLATISTGSTSMTVERMDVVISYAKSLEEVYRLIACDDIQEDYDRYREKIDELTGELLYLLSDNAAMCKYMERMEASCEDHRRY